mgnify:CR=1 FL=1
MTLDFKKLLNDNIIGLLGLESLPMSEKVEMIEKMNLLISKRVMLRIMDLLSNEDASKMAEKEKSPMDMMNFIAEKIPNLNEIVEQEVVKLKEEMLKVSQGV